MNNVVHMPNAHDWKYFANKIAAAWSKQAASIVEAGQLLIEGKDQRTPMLSTTAIRRAYAIPNFFDTCAGV